MAGRPTVVTGPRRQQKLRSWSSWPQTSILINPGSSSHAARHRSAGGQAENTIAGATLALFPLPV